MQQELVRILRETSLDFDRHGGLDSWSYIMFSSDPHTFMLRDVAAPQLIFKLPGDLKSSHFFWDESKILYQSHGGFFDWQSNQCTIPLSAEYPSYQPPDIKAFLSSLWLVFQDCLEQMPWKEAVECSPFQNGYLPIYFNLGQIELGEHSRSVRYWFARKLLQLSQEDSDVAKLLKS